MPHYETVFIARQDLTDTQVSDLSDKFCQIIKDQGGTVTKTENWGLRTLAYRINKNRKGHYVLIESEAPGSALIELERLMRLEEDILRSINVRLNAPSEGPSPMMDKSKGDSDKETTRKANKEAA